MLVSSSVLFTFVPSFNARGRSPKVRLLKSMKAYEK